MPNHNASNRLVLGLLVSIPLVAVAETSEASGCWRPSEVTSMELNGGCPPELPCVELEDDNGQVYATDCCDQEPLDCANQCLMPGGVRPIYIQEDLIPEQHSKVSADFHHVPPRIPLFVDHMLVAPEAIGQFDGTPLHYLVCQTKVGRVVFHAFTSKKGLERQLRECVLGDSSFLVQEAPGQATSGIALFEGGWWEEASYFLPSGQSITLTDTYWDDRITSLRGLGRGTTVTMFESADFSGSSLTLPTDLGLPDLGAFGWDARASSLIVWPVAPTFHKPLQDVGTSR